MNIRMDIIEEERARSYIPVPMSIEKEFDKVSSCWQQQLGYQEGNNSMMEWYDMITARYNPYQIPQTFSQLSNPTPLNNANWVIS